MMDRDGRLLETWGGRRGWNSSSCFYLLHTHTHAGSFAYILLAVLHVCTIQSLAYTLTPLCTHMQARVALLARGLPELDAGAC